MSKKTNTIELNGRRYNATTGNALPELSAAAPLGHSLEGVMHSPAATKKLSSDSVAKQAPLISVVTQPIMDVTRSRPNHRPSHEPQHAKTLMRTAVAKPAPSLKRQLKAQSPSGLQANPVTPVLSPKLSSQEVDPSKVARAIQTPRSPLVQRFNKSIHPSSETLTTEVAPSTTTNEPRTAIAATTPQEATQQPSLDIFERALSKATSHEQPYVTPDSKRWHLSARLKVASGLCAVIIIVGGLLIYKNVSNINLYMASSKAGFQASLPSYRPSGFKLGTISANTGSVAARFTSSSDGQVFTLTEEPSDWDSPTLKETFVVSVAAQNYQTIQSAGITIFLYGNHNATWVSGGIWYQLTSSGVLSNKQLIQIASSV